LRVRAFSLNAQPATRNFQLACFEFVATHLGWVVKAVFFISPFAVHYSSLAIRHSLSAIHCLSDLPICPSHDLPKTWLGSSLALPFSRPSSRVPRPVPVPCPMSLSIAQVNLMANFEWLKCGKEARRCGMR